MYLLAALAGPDDHNRRTTQACDKTLTRLGDRSAARVTCAQRRTQLTRTWMHSVLLPAQLGHTGSVFHDATVSPPRLVSLWLPCQTPLKKPAFSWFITHLTQIQCNCLLCFKKSNLLPKDEDVWLLRKGHKNAQGSLPGIPNGELPKGHLCSFRRFYQKRFRTQRPVENGTVYCLPRFNKWQPLLVVVSRYSERKSQVTAILEAPMCIHPCPILFIKDNHTTEAAVNLPCQVTNNLNFHTCRKCFFLNSIVFSFLNSIVFSSALPMICCFSLIHHCKVIYTDTAILSKYSF